MDRKRARCVDCGSDEEYREGWYCTYCSRIVIMPTDAAIAETAERINSMYYPVGSFAQADWLRSSPPTVQHITNLIRELLKGGSDAKAT